MTLSSERRWKTAVFAVLFPYLLGVVGFGSGQGAAAQESAAGEARVDDTENGADRYDAMDQPEGGSTSSGEDQAVDASHEDRLEEVIAKAVKAYGGEDALRKFDDSATVFGKVVPGGGTAESAFTYRKFRKAKKWRVDLEAPAAGQAGPVKRVLAFNGLAGWRSTGNTVVDLNPVRLAQLNDDNEYQPSLLLFWGSDEWSFTLKGRTIFRGVPVYAVQIAEKRNSSRQIDLFIDQRNFLVVGVSYNTETGSDGSERKIAMEYEEYRPLSGTMFPYRQTKLINNKEASELIIASASLEDAIDESVFDRPQSAGKVTLVCPVTVDFEYSQKEILVKGRLNNGDELLFLFDTGASDTLIDRRVAAEHFLAKQGKQNMMALSGAVNVDSTVIKRLELGSLIVNDLDARIVPLDSQSRQLGRRIAGIIGTNLIRKFVVKLDYGKPSITFYDTDTFERPKTGTMVPFLQPNAPVVKAKLAGGVEMAMLVDTGAAFNNLPTAVARKQMAQLGSQSSHTTEGSGLDGRRLKLASLVIPRVDVGGQSMKNVNFTYVLESKEEGGSARSDSKLVEEQGGFFRSTSIGILGNPYWQNFVTIVDYKFQRLILSPNPMVAVKEQIEAAVQEGDSKLLVHGNFRLAETAYQKALMVATTHKDRVNEARLYGRIANMRRMMAKELARPEQCKTAYEFFVKGHNLAVETGDREVEGRILADWSLLYSDNGQMIEAKQNFNRALLLAPRDPQVNVDYALHLSRLNQLPQMQSYLEKALFYDPSNWQALWYQFKLFEKFMDYPRAIKTLKEIKKYYPWSKPAASRLAQLETMVKASPVPKTP
ncbi:MAG: aspartyl protease family protein [Cyanobacteria bacterium HKST-UBA02]|nr:aspartyl protease family protein [Cyanobacteria bacterium HKST-UBA02]